MVILIILTLFTVAFLVACSIFLYVEWGSHVEMVKEHCSTWEWGTFAQFEREYAKVEWEERDPDFPESHFGLWLNLSHRDEIHANIIKFGDVGMILKPWDYFLFKLWEKKHTYRKEDRQVYGHWDKE